MCSSRFSTRTESRVSTARTPSTPTSEADTQIMLSRRIRRAKLAPCELPFRSNWALPLALRKVNVVFVACTEGRLGSIFLAEGMSTEVPGPLADLVGTALRWQLPSSTPRARINVNLFIQFTVL